MEIPRKEYPRPQFIRKDWINLNGEWQFEIDNGKSGEARGLQKVGAPLKDSILVPFCPESELSGIGHKDFIYGAWYKRTVQIPKQKGRVLLHFGAVDYRCRVFVNGQLVGQHKGGFISFSFDITDALQEGENEITVFAQDDTRNRLIPSGKQSHSYNSYQCFYTRTTGIWQTVWLEFLPETHIQKVKFYPNIADGSVAVEAQLEGAADFGCEVFFEGEPMGSYFANNAAGQLRFTIPLKEAHLWELGKGNLYDVCLTFGEDQAESYFGLRQIRLEGKKFLLNGKSVFQRLILDQGFWPQSIYTAPTDQELEMDIRRGMELGFNGARMHEKIFEERYLYHADRLGYMVWGEYPDWGLDHSYEDNVYAILPEWMEELERDFNHPSIVCWVPHNETWDQAGRKPYDPAISLIYNTTKAIDPTRPCIDASGHFHLKTDIYDVHNYEQDPIVFKENYEKLLKGETPWDRFGDRQTYGGEPYFVSEYGGIRWAEGENDATRMLSWGYGKNPKDLEDFYYRYEGLAAALLDNPMVMGLCYTQLTDVEQEENGLYTYDRKLKFDKERLYAAMARKAAIED